MYEQLSLFVVLTFFIVKMVAWNLQIFNDNYSDDILVLIAQVVSLFDFISLVEVSDSAPLERLNTKFLSKFVG